MKKTEAISILATSVRPREPKDRARYDEAVKMAIEALKCSETPKSSERIAETAQNVQNGNLISRKDAIDAVEHITSSMSVCVNSDECHGMKRMQRQAVIELTNLPSALPDNQINLCDSCDYSYPDCPAKNDDVIFGNGIGNDNICACNKYKPSAQPERKKGRWLRYGEDGYPNNEDTVFWQCDQCLEQYTGRTKRIPNFCPNCGADMREET